MFNINYTFKSQGYKEWLTYFPDMSPWILPALFELQIKLNSFKLKSKWMIHTPIIWLIIHTQGCMVMLWLAPPPHSKKVPVVNLEQALSVWALAFSWYSGFLPQSKDMFRLIDCSLLSVGANLRLSLCLCICWLCAKFVTFLGCFSPLTMWQVWARLQLHDPTQYE